MIDHPTPHGGVVSRMRSLNIGCGKRPIREAGWVNLDISGDPDILCDLEDARLPFADNTFDVIEADHVIEHITNLLPLVEELWRVTKPDGTFLANVPYAGADMAVEDPTHVRFFAPMSFGFFSQPIYWRSDYGYRGDWKAEKVFLCVTQEDFDRYGLDYLHDRWNKDRNVVSELRAVLRCVKPARPQGGQQDILTVQVLPITYEVRNA